MDTLIKTVPEMGPDEQELTELAQRSRLTESEEQFCLLFAESNNAYGSYLQVFPDTLPQLVWGRARALLNKKEIITRVTELYSSALSPHMRIFNDIVESLTLQMKANPDELVSIEQGCCRYCWGKDFNYQFKTPREWGVEAEKLRRKRKKNEPPPEVPEDPPGGYGFNPTLPPNEHCPECSGRGTTYHYARDTRNLSVFGRAIYRGVQIDRAGNVLPKLADPNEARMELLRILVWLHTSKLPAEKGRETKTIDYQSLTLEELQNSYLDGLDPKKL